MALRGSNGAASSDALSRIRVLVRIEAYQFLTRLDEQLSDSIIMKAIQIRAHGGPEVLKLEECPIPEIASDEVLIRVHAAGPRVTLDLPCVE